MAARVPKIMDALLITVGILSNAGVSLLWEECRVDPHNKYRYLSFRSILNKVPPFATKLLSVHLFIIITPYYMFRPTGRPSSRAI
jgi:hypothetical protein